MKKFYILLTTFLIFATSSVFGADMRFIQVDNLFYSSSNPKSQKQLENLITDINRQKNVDFIVFSGNNIASPNQKNLNGFLDAIKSLNSPYYIILGNKDVNKNKNMGKEEYMNFVRKKAKAHKKIFSPNYTFEKKGLVFIVVDGSKEVLPTSIGYYKAETLDWLEEQLIKYNDKKIVILQHFPLIPPAKKETRYTYKAEEYLELLSNHNNVLAVVSGHFGVNKEQKYNNILHISTGSVPSYKIIDILDYDSESPLFWSVTKH